MKVRNRRVKGFCIAEGEEAADFYSWKWLMSSTRCGDFVEPEARLRNFCMRLTRSCCWQEHLRGLRLQLRKAPLGIRANLLNPRKAIHGPAQVCRLRRPISVIPYDASIGCMGRCQGMEHAELPQQNLLNMVDLRPASQPSQHCSEAKAVPSLLSLGAGGRIFQVRDCS
jgi:hypothetical protein